MFLINLGKHIPVSMVSRASVKMSLLRLEMQGRTLPCIQECNGVMEALELSNFDLP
jgi:hypothetical protein